MAETSTKTKHPTILGINWRIVMMLVFILVPLVNFAVPTFFETQERFADDPQTRVSAAGYAFAIWGVIFSGMILFSAYLLFGNEQNSRELQWGLICLSVAGVASILFVPISIYGDQILSFIDILFHLIPLILANRMLRLHAANHPSSNIGRWSFFGPSMYFGWISAAAVISTSLMADQIGIELGESLATSISILVVVALGTVGVWLSSKCDPVYGITVAWALIAVGVEQAAYPVIQMTAWLMAGVVGCAVLLQLTRQPKFFAVNAAGDS